MTGSKESYLKYKASQIAHYGSEEAWKAAQAEYGRKGGKAKVPKGFAKMQRERLIMESTKGGYARHKRSVV